MPESSPLPTPDFGESMALFEQYQTTQDPEALNLLFRRYHKRLSRKISILMSARVRSQFEASDIAQSVLIKGYEKIHQFEFQEPASLMRWLSAIALNILRNKGRKVANRNEQQLSAMEELKLVDLGGPAHRTDQPFDQLEKEELEHITDQSICALSTDHRTVILLRDFDRASWAHIGSAMGRTAAAAHQLHIRAKASLAAELVRRGVTS